MAQKTDKAQESGGNQPDKMPPAGPHARPERMNPDLTPGTGSLPPVGAEDDDNMQPTG